MLLRCPAAPWLGVGSTQFEPPRELGNSPEGPIAPAHALSPVGYGYIDQAPPFPQDDTLQRRPEETQT